MKNKNLKIPKVTKDKFQEILEVISSFCDEKLDDDYLELAIELIAKLARKKPSPLLSGKTNTWAVGIIHALGTINFLFDKSNKPYISSKDLADYFGLSQSTISAKSKSIRDLFKMRPLDLNWTLKSNIDSNHMGWMVMVDGYIMDIRQADINLQIQAYEQGIIPYVPAMQINNT